LGHVQHAAHVIVVSTPLHENELQDLRQQAMDYYDRSNNHNQNNKSIVSLPTLQLVSSLDHALDVARQIANDTAHTPNDSSNTTTTTTTASTANHKLPGPSVSSLPISSVPVPPPSPPFMDTLSCWIAGGERLYQNALTHESAHYVVLTVVEFDTTTTHNHHTKECAKFPPKYRWDVYYRMIDKQEGLVDDKSQQRYSIYWYERIRRPRQQQQQQQSPLS